VDLILSVLIEMSEYFGGSNCLKLEEQVVTKCSVSLFAFGMFQLGRFASRPDVKTSVFVRDMPAGAEFTCLSALCSWSREKRRSVYRALLSLISAL
jgi:hypothetical protein